MRVLVVEDNPKMGGAIKKGLEEAGMIVDNAERGYEGEELAKMNEYDVIILDVMLPDRDGIDVCRSLRRMEVTTPILVLTALSQTHQKVEGLDAGADDYMAKPFDFDELLARVRALLRRGQAGEARTLAVADLELDLYSRVAVRQGQMIELSNKEFGLLEYFMRNEHRVLSRTQIAQKVWDMNFEPTSNVIDVYVSALRKKVDKDFDRDLIHTVKGVGYRFGLAESLENSLV